MSIHAISGKPGGGKSLFGMKALVNELRTTDRYIVTNLAVKLPELCAYVQQEYGQTFNALQRICILDEEQTAKFWLYRGNGLKLPDQERNEFGTANYTNWYHIPDAAANVFYEETSGITVRGYRKGGVGVCYIIDEIHLFFNAREWAKTGKGALYYLSQHRKCGDDVLWITQFVENVDKQFRSVTQDFTYLRNYKNEKFMSFFQSLPWFGYATYQSPQSSALSIQQPTERGRFLLDAKGLAACYDTAKGVGFAGGVAADTKRKRKGLPIWTLLLVGLAMMVIIPLVFVGIQKSVRAAVSHMGAKAKDTNAVVSQVIPIPLNLNTHTNSYASVTKSERLQSTNTEHVSNHEEVLMSGFIHLNGVWVVSLSNGRTVYSTDPYFEELTPSSLKYAGKVYQKALAARSSEGSVINQSHVQTPLVSAPSAPSSRPARVHWKDGETITTHPVPVNPTSRIPDNE